MDHLPCYAEREGGWPLDADDVADKANLDELPRPGHSHPFSPAMKGAMIAARALMVGGDRGLEAGANAGGHGFTDEPRRFVEGHFVGVDHQMVQ